MDNHVQIKIEWKCKSCGSINPMSVTRRNVESIDHQLRQKCLECKTELAINVHASQEVPRW